MPVPGKRKTGDDWCADNKLAVVIETAAMSESELSAYCREKDLYPEQIQGWKEACLQRAGQQHNQQKETQRQHKHSRKKIDKLESGLRRKDKALAETTSLLVL